jgi:Cu(I)/Ag(I) efflux system membrane fusion protein
LYLQIQGALAADDFNHVHQLLIDLQSTTAAIDESSITDPQARKAWEEEKAKLAQLLEHAHHLTDIEEVREMFSPMSDEMGVLITLFGLGEASPIYRHHCPMALEGEGAFWFQNHKETRNPYFGASMLECADEVVEIASTGKLNTSKLITDEQATAEASP